MSEIKEPLSGRLALLEEFRQSSEDATTELDMALLVANVIDENLDARKARDGIQRLLDQAESQGVTDVEGLLAFLRGQGFAQSSLDGVDLTHSSIDWLLQQHQGLPIVVAVLIITLAHGLGLEAYGVNYPGHFLLRAQGDLVDPLSLAVVEPSSLQAPSGYDLDELLVKAKPATLGFRMLNNLKAYYLHLGNWQATLAATDYQLAIVHHETGLKSLLHFERGEYQQRMGEAEAALASYLLCLELAGDEALVAQAQERVDELMVKDDRPLH
jgi:regulator of sirC expression with transglutaminase-like and TPR domain